MAGRDNSPRQLYPSSSDGKDTSVLDLDCSDDLSPAVGHDADVTYRIHLCGGEVETERWMDGVTRERSYTEGARRVISIRGSPSPIP